MIDSLPARAPRRAARIQFGVCLAVTLGMLVYLLWSPGTRRATSDPVPGASGDGAIRLTGAGEIHIEAGSPLHRQLQAVAVRKQALAAPVVTVTGTVVASLRPARGKARYWQFSSPDILTTYTDWQKAVADIAFARKQLDSIAQLADTRVRTQTALATRLRKLVEAGTDTEKDLAAAQAELLQAQIQGRKDVHEAETAMRLAQRSEAALARQLQQTGVDPELLRATAGDVDIVVAEVPEALLSRVKLGQGCEARFFGLGGKSFAGKVRSLSPVLSKERRSLRVLFIVDDPEDSLRPGMFADIGLGTDAREALLVPLAGVVHVGRADYLLVRAGETDWRPTEVQVGEVHQAAPEPGARTVRAERGDVDAAVEILAGVRAGDQVLGQGAILLKPLIVEAVQRPHTAGAGGS